MNILFHGFRAPHLVPVLEKVLDWFGVQHCYTIDAEPSDIPAHISNQHYDYRTISKGIYPNFHKSSPLDPKLIEKFYPYESMAMTMMDRFIQPEKDATFIKIRLLRRHLRYWNYFLEEKKINLFLLSNIPHEVHDYIIYHLCKLKNIPTLNFGFSPIPTAIFIMEDYLTFPRKIQSEYKRLLRNSSQEIRLHPEFKKNWDRLRAPQPPVPFYIPKQKASMNKERSILFKVKCLAKSALVYFLKNPKSGIKQAFQADFWRSQYIHLKIWKHRRRKNQKLHDYYKALTENIDFDHPFIFIPLHLQPECSTAPLGGLFCDQMLMVEMLASVIPKDMVLYVKEHPLQKSFQRIKSFYDQLKELPNVKIVCKEVPSFSLIHHCLAVATVTGTAGWEALFKGKPVLVFGTISYMYADGVFNVKDVQSCKRAIHEIQNGCTVNRDHLFFFMKALENFSVIGFQDVFYQQESKLSFKKNAENLFSALSKSFKIRNID